MHESELLQYTETNALREALNVLPNRCFDVEQLFDFAFKRIGKMRKSDIDERRAKQKPDVMLQLRKVMDRNRRALAGAGKLHASGDYEKDHQSDSG